MPTAARRPRTELRTEKIDSAPRSDFETCQSRRDVQLSPRRGAGRRVPAADTCPPSSCERSEIVVMSSDVRSATPTCAGSPGASLVLVSGGPRTSARSPNGRAAYGRCRVTSLVKRMRQITCQQQGSAHRLRRYRAFDPPPTRSLHAHCREPSLVPPSLDLVQGEGISSASSQTTFPWRHTATGSPSRLWRRRASRTASRRARSIRSKSPARSAGLESEFESVMSEAPSERSIRRRQRQSGTHQPRERRQGAGSQPPRFRRSSMNPPRSCKQQIDFADPR